MKTETKFGKSIKKHTENVYKMRLSPVNFGLSLVYTLRHFPRIFILLFLKGALYSFIKVKKKQEHLFPTDESTNTDSIN